MNTNSPPTPTSRLGYNKTDTIDKNNDLELTLFHNNLTGCIESQCPSIIIGEGHENSHLKVMKDFIAPKPFSFSYGGAGAGYGGIGGDGFGANQAGQAYGDEEISTLYGGSGGAFDFSHPFEANMFSSPWGLGGSGGGALELVALNDIVLGPDSVLSCNGEDGLSGYMTAGGGGSGGILFHHAHHRFVLFVEVLSEQ